MKIDKGKIKNINKKLACGAICFTLITTGLTGCKSTTRESTPFYYVLTNGGEYKISGSIMYEALKDCKFVVINNKTFDKQEYYICEQKKESAGLAAWYNYKDIFTNKVIFNTNEWQESREIIGEQSVGDYLFAFEKIKRDYDVEDVQEILNLMKEEYNKSNKKELVKGK